MATATQEVAEPVSFSVLEDAALRNISLKTDKMNAVIKSAKQFAAGNRDHLVKLGDLKFAVNGNITVKIPKVKAPATLTPWAFSQLGARLGVQASMLWKFHKGKHSKLALDIMQTLQKDEGEQDLLLRTTGRGRTIRGVLTPTYTPTDNVKILEAFRDLMPKGFRVSNWQITPDGMVLRVVDAVGEARVKETKQVGSMYCGMEWVNSEVGKRSLGAFGYVFRLWCSNGCLTTDDVFGWSRRHTGDALEEFQEAAEKLFAGLPEFAKGVQEGMTDLRRKVMTEKAALRLISSSMKSTREAGYVKSLFDSKEQAALEVYKEVEAEAKHTKGKATRWGVVNAFTKLAQELPTEQRRAVELWAGSALFLN